MLSPNISKDLMDCSEFGNRSCPESFRSAGVRGVMYLFITVAFIFTILGNLVIIASISYFKQLHSPTNFLILSMAITDFLLGFAIMPYSMVRSVENCWYFGMTFCKVHYSFDLMLCLASIFHLCSIAVDRFYAICHPLHYTSTMTVTAIKQIIAVCWSVPTAFAFGVVFSEDYASGIEGYEMLVKCSSLCPIMFNKLWGAVLFTVGLFAPACIMIGIYVKIFMVSRRHTCKLSQAHRHTKSDKKNELSKNKDRKAAKTLSIVMMGFLICWFLPCFFALLIDPFLNFSTPLPLFDALNWLGYLNSFCNPLIYGFFYPWFRRTFKYILKGKIFSPQFRTIKLSSEDQSP
ncbi:LOW QUALITY PROTEIN: trace amine-associated receptor 2 [Falco naumanni]|uniref:LOW QUALITY PROTEIN: trace amine-associated receptor 2 n=1 Tax=Falco naumanni TaxID=148594 RepID=UPI001ADEAA5E|nr:LOW QUALITY PROTEIN: trace amine-associated receptor 2 [Falco naumanni]